MAINFPDSPTSGDTHTVGDKTWTWNGTSWDVVVSTPISNQIIDADGDTRIHVEESPDEDYIRFDTAGTERMTIGPTGDVAVANDLSVTGTISGGSTSFPTSLDSGTMPAIEALQAKVGADSSAVTSSLDYKVAQLEAISHGKILQVVHATYSTQEDTTSATFVATSLTANITPSDSANKVLAFAYVPMGVNDAASSRSGYAVYEIDRGGTSVAVTFNIGYGGSGTENRVLNMPVTIFALDSPSSTSALTYTVNHRKEVNGTVSSFKANTTGHLVLMEVSA